MLGRRRNGLELLALIVSTGVAVAGPARLSDSPVRSRTELELALEPPVCSLYSLQSYTPLRRSIWGEPPFSTVSSRREAIRLPGLPDSAALTVTALAWLGLWRLGRTVSHLPEWYHQSAPQVGYSLPLQFDSSGAISLEPLCVAAPPLTVLSTRSQGQVETLIPICFLDASHHPRSPPR